MGFGGFGDAAFNRDVLAVLRDLKKLQDESNKIQTENGKSLKRIDENVKKILDRTPPLPPVGFKVSIVSIKTNEKGEMTMGAVKATVDFQLLDNGTAQLTASPVDAAGLAATLPAGTPAASWASSDPGVVITPVASDPTGLTAIAAPATPPVLVTGAVPTVSVTLPGAASPISGTGAPIDVVAGGPTGFTVAEQ